MDFLGELDQSEQDNTSFTSYHERGSVHPLSFFVEILIVEGFRVCVLDLNFHFFVFNGNFPYHCFIHIHWIRLEHYFPKFWSCKRNWNFASLLEVCDWLPRSGVFSYPSESGRQEASQSPGSPYPVEQGEQVGYSWWPGSDDDYDTEDVSSDLSTSSTKVTSSVSERRREGGSTDTNWDINDPDIPARIDLHVSQNFDNFFWSLTTMASHWWVSCSLLTKDKGTGDHWLNETRR